MIMFLEQLEVILEEQDGNGAASRTSASGGTGNPGGNLRSNNGTGGLCIIFANKVINNGNIQSNGVTGGTGWPNGGASGGGSINIFYKDSISKGTITATGGTSSGGGHGGAGTLTTGNIGSKTFVKD